MICKDTAIAYGWQSNFNPFFGFKRLPEGCSYENIQPFTLAEQARIIKALPLHWKPYFMFAFSSGLQHNYLKSHSFYNTNILCIINLLRPPLQDLCHRLNDLSQGWNGNLGPPARPVETDDT